jgi:hypothetical protein
MPSLAEFFPAFVENDAGSPGEEPAVAPEASQVTEDNHQSVLDTVLGEVRPFLASETTPGHPK